MIRLVQLPHHLKYLIFIRNSVDLIERDDYVRRFVDVPEKLRILVFAQRRIHHPQHGLRLGQRVLEAAIHGFSETCAVFGLKPWCIQKYQLRRLARDNAQYVLARGLRPPRGNADLLPDQRIE